MTRVWVIATNTFREAVRDKVLHSILFFAVILLGISLALREVSIGDTEKIVRGVALGGISLLAGIIAIFLGVGLVYKEIEQKTIYTLACKPMPRWQLLLGKYLGLWLTLAAEVTLLTVFYTVIIGLQQGFPSVWVYVSMGMLMLELTLLTAWSILYSTFATPTTAAAFSLCTFLVGHLADDIALFAEKADPGPFKTLLQVLYRIVPNLEMLNLRTEAVHAMPVPLSELGYCTIYALGYTAAVLSIAMIVFERCDFK
jgi:ABC-type transport system involved in multi-copper enzyme maturation permease subunit